MIGAAMRSVMGASSLGEGVGGEWFENISDASYDSVYFDVNSQESSPRSLAFSSDGSKMYLIGVASDRVYQYTLSTPWDLSTASYDSVYFDVNSQESSPHGLVFSSDGSKMYLIGVASDRVYQYTLSTPWDLSTASYDSVYFDVNSQESSPRSLAFSSNGSKMYVSGSANDKVHQYTLSTPWDLSTASYDSVYFDVSAQDTLPLALTFSSDGSKMYITGFVTPSIFQYTLSTPWDLSTASYDSDSLDVSTQDTTPYGLFFSADGSKMYISGDTNDKVYQYSTN